MFDLVLLALLCGFVVAACIATVWLLTAARVRRRWVIPVHPQLMETHGEQIPEELKVVLADVVPVLERLGFTIVANMHAPELAAMFIWTQVLFIHRERGDRASVMYLRPVNPAGPNRSHPALAFATEWADGRSVKTVKTIIPQPTEAAVVESYERHRRDVEAQQPQTGRAMRGVVPDVGKEAVWLRERAGRIAESIARQMSFVLDPDGVNYRLPRRRALRAAWVGLWKKRRGRDRGFDVIPPPPDSDTPSPDDP